MKTTGPYNMFEHADVGLIEEAADAVNLVTLDLAIQAFEQNLQEGVSTAGEMSIVKMAERGKSITSMMSRVISLRSPA